jgi:hypothetical protein
LIWKGDGKVDLSLPENVTCKYVRIIQGNDSKYFDPVFYLQELYCPNVKDNSLTVFQPGIPSPTIVVSGSLFTWDAIQAKPRMSTTNLKSSNTKKSNPKRSLKQVSTPVAKAKSRLRATDISTKSPIIESLLATTGVASIPSVKAGQGSVVMWVPNVIQRSRGMFQESSKSIKSREKIKVNSVPTHLRMVEDTNDLTSTFDIQLKTQGRRACHTLISVHANGNSYSMENIDISIVIAIFDRRMKTSTVKTPMFDRRRDAISFGQLFLLLMVYPGYWFPTLFGTPGVLGDAGRTVFVDREANTGFFLTKVGENGWNVTPESSNNTYEYK